eukprot:m.6974 g.6974  ORF g.6974 m.6974 type:complete len:131 (-) comp5626_c0_seq1:191-583(-)
MSKEHRDAFFIFAGNSATLNFPQLTDCLRSLGFNFTDSELKAKAGASTDMSTFLSIASSMSAPSHEDNEELLDALRSFDKTSRGTLSSKEFSHYTGILGNTFTPEEVAQVMKFDEDGLIDYEVMVKKMVA